MNGDALARWMFEVGDGRETEALAVSERDMGDLGRVFVASY